MYRVQIEQVLTFRSDWGDAGGGLGGPCGDGDQPPPPSSIQKVSQPNLYLLQDCDTFLIYLH